MPITKQGRKLLRLICEQRGREAGRKWFYDNLHHGFLGYLRKSPRGTTPRVKEDCGKQ